MIPPLEVPPDFDAYWDAVRREAAQHPLELHLSPWDAGGQAQLPGLRLQRLAFTSVGGVRVGGIVHRAAGPAAATRPALLHLTGYGGELLLHQDLAAAGFVVLDFSHRGMAWGSDGFDRHHPRPLVARDVEDRQRYVYRAIYLDCLLGLRALRQLEGVDPDRIGVLGTSQGGGLTIGMAALGDVRAAAADLPWLTHFARQLGQPVDGPYNEIRDVVTRHPELAGAVHATLAYYDTTSFATRLRVPTLVSLGQADSVCPPDSIRVLFDRIPALKTLLEVPGLGHERSLVWRRLAADWMRMWV